MNRYTFPGFFEFLHDAAARIGRPEAEAPARTTRALSALANLCAQAGAADPEHAAAILAKAAEFRDQLHAAYEAAESILAETRRHLGLADEADQGGTPPPPPEPLDDPPAGSDDPPPDTADEVDGPEAPATGDPS